MVRPGKFVIYCNGNVSKFQVYFNTEIEYISSYCINIREQFRCVDLVRESFCFNLEMKSLIHEKPCSIQFFA